MAATAHQYNSGMSATTMRGFVVHLQFLALAALLGTAACAADDGVWADGGVCRMGNCDDAVTYN